MAQRPLVVYGKLRGSANGRIVVSGMSGQGRFEQALSLRPSDVRAENAPLRWLWARKWVETLEDERHMGGGKPVEEAITNLGLGYNLLTAFTSFVAVDTAVVNQGGASEAVKQPLPLPEGVSNQAVAEEGMVGGVIHRQFAAKARRATSAEPEDEDKQEESGSSGAGSGYGSTGGRAAAPAPAAPPPSTPRPSVAEALPPRAAATAGSSRPASAPRPARPSPAKGDKGAARVTLGTVSAVGDPQALLRQVQALLPRIDRCQGRPPGGELALKLTVDGAGKVVKVELARGPAAVLGCLRRHLLGLVTAARATGATPGMVEVVIRL
jgi:hypothetical protein